MEIQTDVHLLQKNADTFRKDTCVHTKSVHAQNWDCVCQHIYVCIHARVNLLTFTYTFRKDTCLHILSLSTHKIETVYVDMFTYVYMPEWVYLRWHLNIHIHSVRIYTHEFSYIMYEYAYLYQHRHPIAYTPCVQPVGCNHSIGVAMAEASRLLKIISTFCKWALLNRLYPAKEYCNFKKPTNRSHPI